MEIRCSAFVEGGMIPEQYSCDGADISPPLVWGDVPAGVESFVLICDDPDAPLGTWVHWVYFDLPGSMRELPAQVEPAVKPAIGGVQGLNDFKKHGYGGPCPPGGTHRYFFKLYALDAKLGLSPGATKKQVVAAMGAHVLAEASLMGRYKRAR